MAAVLEEMDRCQAPPGTLRVVRVVAGQQQQIVPESLVFAYELLTQGTPAAGSRLELRILPLEAHCPACGWRGAVEPPIYLCGGCGGIGLELSGGCELFLESLEVARSDEPARKPAEPGGAGAN